MPQERIGGSRLVQVDNGEDRASVGAGDFVEGGECLPYILGLMAVRVTIDKLNQRVDDNECGLGLHDLPAKLVGVLGHAEGNRLPWRSHSELRHTLEVSARREQPGLEGIPWLILRGDNDYVSGFVQVAIKFPPRHQSDQVRPQ